jgi:AraC family transcriptional regulator, transcriptional activator FtrA
MTVASGHLVVALLVDGMSALEPAVASDFFSFDPNASEGPWYEFRFAGLSRASIRVGEFKVMPEGGLSLLRSADTIIIPGWCDSTRPASAELIKGLQAAYRRGARLVSFCTGAFVLAQSGLLDNRPATTHWRHADRLALQFPRIQVNPDVLYVDDGQILTSAGAAASIDLALYIIRSDFGADAANRVARSNVVAPHRGGGQAQYVEAPVACHPCDFQPVNEAMTWAIGRLDQPITVAALAEVALLSPRQFLRVFRDHIGDTPHQWLLGQRTALAQRLLETTDRSIENIAAEAGFGTAAALRLHFQRVLQVSPASYRRTFNAA